MKCYSILLVLITFSFWAQAQKNYTLTLSGYTDFYYSDFNNLSADDFQPYTTVGAVPGVFKNNITLVGLNFQSKNVRANFTTHSGKIVGATWDSQLPQIQEANVGVHLIKDLYFDIGYFTTHIGMESFMPKENLLSSTSIITYNEPFYQRGAKLHYEGLKHFDLQLWLLDGYNLFRDNNENKSIGLLASYGKGNFSATYCNIIGREPTDNGNELRTYHNMYITYEFYKNIFELNTGIDFATQTDAISDDLHTMFAYIATLRVNVTKRLSVTGRVESQTDKNSILSSTYTYVNDIGVEMSEGIDMIGLTGGIAYELSDKAYFRYEIRRLSDREQLKDIFGDSSSRVENLFTIGLMFEAEFVKKQMKK